MKLINNKYYKIYLCIVAFATFYVLFNISTNIESFQNINNKFASINDSYILMNDNKSTYPLINNKNEVSNHSVSDIWWYYPIFKVGSYAQITNNIKYPRNPDIGQCTPPELCGTLYHSRQKFSRI